MTRASPATVLVTAGWAAIGMLVGHVAAYDLVYPDAHVHAAALDESGHAWLALVGPSMVLAVTVALVAAWASRAPTASRPARFRTLASLQIGAFVGVELLERLAMGLSPADIGHALIDHGLWLVLATGVLVQLVTAWLGSAASRAVVGLRPAATRRRPPQRGTRPPILSLREARPFRTSGRRAHAPRAPPLRASLLST